MNATIKLFREGGQSPVMSLEFRANKMRQIPGEREKVFEFLNRLASVEHNMKLDGYKPFANVRHGNDVYILDNAVINTLTGRKDLNVCANMEEA